MTVRELIAKLERINPDAEVRAGGKDGNPIEDVHWAGRGRPGTASLCYLALGPVSVYVVVVEEKAAPSAKGVDLRDQGRRQEEERLALEGIKDLRLTEPEQRARLNYNPPPPPPPSISA